MYMNFGSKVKVNVKIRKLCLYKVSYISAHVLLKLLNESEKSDKMLGLLSIVSLFHNELKNSIIKEHAC